MQHKGCWGASSAEDTVVTLMQCPLLVTAGICNLFRVPAIAHQLFTKDTTDFLTSNN